MNFGTRPARPGIAHFPKIILFVSVDDALGGKVFFPISGGFIVALQVFFGTAFKNGSIQAVGV